MKLSTEARNKLIRDALVSILLYALPVLLMFLSFYVSGKKPWVKQTTTTQINK